jgi:hypothetical protein
MAAFAAPYEPAPFRAAMEPIVTTRASSVSRGESAVVTSTAVSTLESKFARHAAARPSRSPTSVRSRSVLPPALFTSTSTDCGRSSIAAATALGSAASKTTAFAPSRPAAS